MAAFSSVEIWRKTNFMAFEVNGCQCRYSGSLISARGMRRGARWRRKRCSTSEASVVRRFLTWLAAINHLLLCSAPNTSQSLSRAATDSSDSPHHIYFYSIFFWRKRVQGIQATSCRNKSHLNIDVAFNEPF